MTDRTPEQILDLAITAAGTADVVRLSSLIHNAVLAAPDIAFTRPVLTDLWSLRWPRHLAGHGSRRPEARVNRSLPNLIAVGVVSGVQGPDMRVLDGALLRFLAERVYMAEALDVQHPLSNTLPVGEVTRAALVELLAAPLVPPSPAVTPEPDSPSPAVSGQPAGG